MADIIYYLPGPVRGSATRDDLTKVGLAHALDADTDGVTSIHTNRGPDDGEGRLVGIGKRVPEFKPSFQTWRKGPGGQYWAGFSQDHRPTPQDLARARIHDGKPVQLLDGNLWIIPRCVSILPERPVTLPRVLDLAEDAETVIAKTHPQYAKLCEGAYRFWQAFSRQTDRLPVADEVRIAVEALAVNYRVGKLEVIGLLGLWGTDEFGEVLRAMIDADEIEAHYAAKEAEEQDPKKTPASAARGSDI